MARGVQGGAIDSLQVRIGRDRGSGQRSLSHNDADGGALPTTRTSHHVEFVFGGKTLILGHGLRATIAAWLADCVLIVG